MASPLAQPDQDQGCEGKTFFDTPSLPPNVRQTNEASDLLI
jgi:hypothetical protein